MNDDIFTKAAYSPTPPYPGTPLRVGSSGSDVALMQTYLNAIRGQLYPNLNRLTVDGKYGNATKTTVMQYQAIKKLSVDGVIGAITWNSIVADYSSLPVPGADVYPGIPLSQGSKGTPVLNMQIRLNEVHPTYTAIAKQTADGSFGPNMANATRLFQKQFGLVGDEVIGENTWDKIVAVHTNVKANNPDKVATKYPGYTLQVGSSGDSVRYIQSYLNTISQKRNYGWQPLTVDGNFGNKTKQVVVNFQAKYSLKIDGIVGNATWSKMVSEFNAVV
ncbi:MAG: peptidoglycan-binding protein [Oscillospiraceae bacterium]